MAETDFKLPHSSFAEIKKLLIAFAKRKAPASLDDLNKLTGIHKTVISSNNGFLESIGAVTGGNKKEATEEGKKLGLALANSIDDQASSHIRNLFSENEFLESMITALDIKPRTNDDFQSHIAYSLGKELKGRNRTGSGALIEMMLYSNMIVENEGLLSPNKKYPILKVNPLPENVEPKLSGTEENKPSDQQSITRRLTNELGQNVTLNINIQLTIPDTEDEKIYESFFKAMKKHLLS